MIARDPEPYKRLQPGEPWVLIEDRPVLCEKTGAQVRAGDTLSKWFDSGEYGRLFRIERVHPPATYETTFVGFLKLDSPDPRRGAGRMKGGTE